MIAMIAMILAMVAMIAMVAIVAIVGMVVGCGRVGLAIPRAGLCLCLPLASAGRTTRVSGFQPGAANRSFRPLRVQP